MAIQVGPQERAHVEGCFRCQGNWTCKQRRAAQQADARAQKSKPSQVESKPYAVCEECGDDGGGATRPDTGCAKTAERYAWEGNHR